MSLVAAGPALAAPAAQAKRVETRADRAVQTRVATRAATPAGKTEKAFDGGISLLALLLGGGAVGLGVALGVSGSSPSP